PSSTISRTSDTACESWRSASGLATPPGRTRTSMSAAVASPVVRSTGCVPAAVRWSTRPASPDEVLTRTGVCPASVTAAHGSVTSTPSIPSPATRKAIVRLSVCASWFSVIPRLCVHACWSATAGAGWDQRQAGPVGASPPDSLALSTLSGSRRGSRRRRTSSAPDHREKPADAPTDSRDARPVGRAFLAAQDLYAELFPSRPGFRSISPPFGALVFVPLVPLPAAVAQVAWTGATIAAVWAILAMAAVRLSLHRAEIVALALTGVA